MSDTKSVRLYKKVQRSNHPFMRRHRFVRTFHGIGQSHGILSFRNTTRQGLESPDSLVHAEFSIIRLHTLHGNIPRGQFGNGKGTRKAVAFQFDLGVVLGPLLARLAIPYFVIKVRKVGEALWPFADFERRTGRELDARHLGLW